MIEIRPSNIDTSQHFWNAFGSSETEVSALWIVQFCKQRGGDDWRPFAHADLAAFYCEKKMTTAGAFRYNQLTYGYSGTRPWLYEIGGLVHITQDFVVRCFRASPMADFPGVSPDRDARPMKKTG